MRAFAPVGLDPRNAAAPRAIDAPVSRVAGPGTSK